MNFEHLTKMYQGNVVFKQIVDLFEAYVRSGLVTPGVLRDAVNLVEHRLNVVEPT